ncbi:hypothetical protein BS17DRAFT_351350 [Gyrodon lividus]|nr:hypothetical protein BS17DRAFT_351350 [Gyrodon lividus]
MLCRAYHSALFHVTGCCLKASAAAQLDQSITYLIQVDAGTSFDLSPVTTDLSVYAPLLHKRHKSVECGDHNGFHVPTMCSSVTLELVVGLPLATRGSQNTPDVKLVTPSSFISDNESPICYYWASYSDRHALRFSKRRRDAGFNLGS